MANTLTAGDSTGNEESNREFDAVNFNSNSPMTFSTKAAYLQRWSSVHISVMAPSSVIQASLRFSNWIGHIILSR